MGFDVGAHLVRLGIVSSTSDHASVVSINIFVALLFSCIVIGHLLEENRWMNGSITVLIIGLCTGVVILLTTKGKSSHPMYHISRRVFELSARGAIGIFKKMDIGSLDIGDFLECIRSLVSRILPTIGSILEKPKLQPIGLVAGSLDLLTMILKMARGALTLPRGTGKITEDVRI